MDIFGSLNISYGEDVYFNCLLNYMLYLCNGKMRSISKPNCYYYIINENSVSHKKFDINLYKFEIESFIKADEKVGEFIGNKINFSDELIFNLGNYYMHQSKYYNGLTKKESISVVKTIFNNKQFQHSVSRHNPNSFLGIIKKFFIKLKLAKLVYMFI